MSEYILNNKGGSGCGGGEAWTLLWENHNTTPTYTFDAQTLNIDLAGYEAIAIEGVSFGGYPPHDSRLNGEYQLGICQNRVGRYFYIGSHGNIATARKVTIVNGGLQFGIGYQGTGQFNTVSIPYKIWGIKKLAIPSEVYGE